MPPRRVVVVPTYNEATSLPLLLEAVRRQAPGFELLIVDDNSPDGTGAVADEASRADPAVSVIHRPSKAGLGSAYVAGFHEAMERGADEIFEMDADLSHNPMYLPGLSEALAEADVSIGSRYRDGVRVNNWPFRRLLLSKAANFYAVVATGLPFDLVTDVTSGFRGYRREALRQVGLGSIRSSGYAFQVEMVFRCYRAGLHIREVPIVFEEHSLSSSKMSGDVILEAVWKIPLLRFLVPPIRGAGGPGDGL